MEKVMITAIGCPNGHILARKLSNYELIGTDMNKDVFARRFVDRFYTVPAASTGKEYRDVISAIMEKENPLVVIPQSEEEVCQLLRLNYDEFIIPEWHAFETSLRKSTTYKQAKKYGIPVPKFKNICYPDEINETEILKYLKYYENGAFVIKPDHGKGSRGFRVVVPEVDRINLSFKEWPNIAKISVNELNGSVDLTGYIASEYLTGMEYAFEGYCEDGEILTGFIKKKDRKVHNGFNTINTVVEDHVLWEYSTTLLDSLYYTGFVDIQYIEHTIIELNCRLSTLIYTDDYNMPDLVIQYLLGKISKKELSERKPKTGSMATFYWDLWFDEA